MDRLFWIIATLVFTAVVHITYILYAQRIEMNGFIDEAAASAESNGGALKVLPAGLAQNSATYICPFDLTSGAFKFNATMPEGPWVIAIYTKAGQNIFAVSDQQAGAQVFTITIKKQRGLGGIFAPGDDAGWAEDEWHVESAEPKGLVLAWAAVVQDGERRRIEETLRKSVCKNADMS
jgi:uncharacterized membrane protein